MSNPHASGPDSWSDVRGVDRRAMRDQIYDRILAQLLSGRLEPGQRLSIEMISRQLGVSQTPIREALVLFERTGLVDREAQKGYRVAQLLQPDELRSMFEARRMLETTAMALAGRHAEVLLPKAQAALAAQRAAGNELVRSQVPVAGRLRAEYFAADAEFHRVIFIASDNRFILDMADGLGAQLHRFQQFVVHGITDVSQALHEHGAIVESIATGDVDKMVTAMQAHIEKVRDRSLSEGH